MATATQVKALLQSHGAGDEERFFAIALQVAAAEARRGHDALAREIRNLVDQAKARRDAPKSSPSIFQWRNHRARRPSCWTKWDAAWKISDLVLSQPLQDRVSRVLDEQQNLSETLIPVDEDYEIKAKKLLSFASMNAIGSRDVVCEFYPHLRSASRFRMWDFFATVLAVWTVYTRIGLDIPEASRASIESIVQAQLQAWNPSGVAALKDLHGLVVRIASGEPDSSKNRALTPLSGGTWLLWNLTDCQPIQDEAQIAATLGRLLVSNFEAYWTS